MPDKKPTLEDIDKAPENLPAVVPQPQPGEVANLQTKFTEVANENFELKAEVNALKGQLGTKTHVDNLLAPMAGRSYVFLCCFALAALALLLLDGFHWGGFDLEPEVMQVVIGSTAVAAIGLVLAINKGMFDVLKK